MPLGRKAFVAAGLCCALSACAMEVPGSSDELAADPQRGRIDGKLSNNGLALAPGTVRALGVGPLGAWTDQSSAVAAAHVGDLIEQTADGVEHLEYVAMCALDAGTSLTLSSPAAGDITFPGLYGLAPAWVDQGCDESCQNWVTACLLAHANAFGVSVPISMRGEHPGLTWGPAMEELHPLQEAAFYGNVFATDPVTSGPALYACFGRALISYTGEAQLPGVDPRAYLEQRICGAGGACGAFLTGACHYPDPRARPCDGDGGTTGAFRDCHATSYGGLASQTPLFREVVTTYLAVPSLP